MMKFLRKNNKIIFLVFTPILAVGLVLSFTIWSSPQASGGATGSNQTQAPQGGDAVKGMLTDIRQFEQALKAAPDNPTMLVNLGNKSYDLGVQYFGLQQVEDGVKYLTKATEAYKKALEIGEPDANVATDLATAAFYSNQYDLADEYFNKALEIDPEHLTAKRNYGVFLMEAMQNYDKAIQQWEAVLALNPDPTTKSSLEQLIQDAKSRK